MHRDAGRVFAARGGVQRQAGGNNEGHETEWNMADGFENRRSQIFLRQRWHCVYVCRLLGMLLATKRLAFHFRSVLFFSSFFPQSVFCFVLFLVFIFVSFLFVCLCLLIFSHFLDLFFIVLFFFAIIFIAQC